MIKPVYDRVLVQEIKKESQTEGGLEIPESRTDELLTGKVIAVGDYNPETKMPLVVKPGDVIRFGQHVGVPITEDGVDYLVIREKNIEVIL